MLGQARLQLQPVRQRPLQGLRLRRCRPGRLLLRHARKGHRRSLQWPLHRHQLQDLLQRLPVLLPLPLLLVALHGRQEGHLQLHPLAAQAHRHGRQLLLQRLSLQPTRAAMRCWTPSVALAAVASSSRRRSPWTRASQSWAGGDPA